MGTMFQTFFQKPSKNFAAKKRAPMIEIVERRELMTGIGFIGGTAFFNAPGSGSASPSYLPGATIQLFKVGTSAPVATMVTDAKGAYSFNALDPGAYHVVETPPAGYSPGGNVIQSQFFPASSVTPGTIQVTIPALSPVILNYLGVTPANYQVFTDSVNGVSMDDAVGQLRVSLGTTAGSTNLSGVFSTVCLDDLHRVTFEGGEQFPVTPTPISALTNGTTTISADRSGRIAYLYNHYGNATLSNIQGPALQLAIWELLYDTGATADFSTGNFHIVAPVAPTTQAELNQVIAQATSYFNDSTGKSETAILLHATSGRNGGYQSMMATGSFDFNNGLVNDDNLHSSSLSGFVYCDQNNNGVKDAADMAINGVIVTLTGTDSKGAPVDLVTTTDATGAYHFLNLNKGVYTIIETQPAGYVEASNTQGTPGTGTVIGDAMVNITLKAGVNGQNNNFGERGKPVGLDSLKLLGIHHQQSQIVLQFNGALDAASARNTANYTLTALGKDQRLGSATNQRVQVSMAVYDAKHNTVTLTPIHHLNIHYHYLLTTKLAPANDCAPHLKTVNVFGRAAVPVFNIHGVVKSAPTMLPWEVQRDRLVVANALNAYTKNTGLITRAAK